MWRKNLRGFFTLEGKELTDAEVRLLVNYAITKGYEYDADIPNYEERVLLGQVEKFKIRSLLDNGSFKKGEVYHAEYRQRGSSYKHRDNIRVWMSDTYLKDGKRYGSYICLSDYIFGNDKMLPTFEIVKEDEE